MDGDIGRAFEWLRKRGIAKASAMADRSANEGTVKSSQGYMNGSNRGTVEAWTAQVYLEITCLIG